MCRRVSCQKCGKPSFAGCGAHVEQVLGDVPRDQRCACHEKKHEEKSATPGEDAQAPTLFRRLFGW